MQDKYSSKGVVLLALSYEKDAVVGKYVKAQDIPYIVGGGAEDTKKAYGIKAFPTMFIVGGDGNIEWVGHPSSPEAEKELERVLKENPPKIKSALGKSDAGATDFEKAEKLYQKKDYAAALKAYEKIAKDYKDTKIGKKAKTKTQEMKDDPKIMAKVHEAKAAKQCEEWLTMARALAKQGKKKEAAEYYDKVIKEYPDTDYARTAEEERSKLKV